MERSQNRYSEELKRNIVKEIESGNISRRDAAREAHTSVTQIEKWLADYGRFKPKRDIIEVVMKSEQEKIAELEKALAEVHLKLRISDKIIELASKEYRVDLKKSFGTEQSRLSAGSNQKRPSKSSAKRRG